MWLVGSEKERSQETNSYSETMPRTKIPPILQNREKKISNPQISENPTKKKITAGMRNTRRKKGRERLGRQGGGR